MATRSRTKPTRPAASVGFLNPGELLRRLDILPGSEVADFGCGAGFFAIPLARLVGEQGVVHAIDVRAAPLEALGGRAKLEGIYVIQTHRADLESPRGSGLADASQDIVLMANILFQVHDRAAVVREAHRVLKSGGRLVAVEWHAEASLARSFASHATQTDVQTLAAAAGFKQEHTLEAGSHHFAIVFRK